MGDTVVTPSDTVVYGSKLMTKDYAITPQTTVLTTVWRDTVVAFILKGLRGRRLQYSSIIIEKTFLA